MIKVGSNGIVQFIFEHKTNTQVYLVGDFNNWNETSHPMQPVEGKWILALQLSPGKYEFKYLAGQSWYTDYHPHQQCTSGWSAENSMIIVESNAIEEAGKRQ